MAFNWFFPQEVIDHKTPSRVDGVPPIVEARYRKEGAKLVINAANTLKLRYDTVATGVVFYHRFFIMQSFKEFNRWVVAAACLLLAGKVEETPKQCKVILKVTRSLLNDQQWAGFGSNPKEELLTHERILLQTIKFDLQVDHPYTFILKFAKELRGDKAEIEKLVQAAWTFVNDSLVTTLSIQWEPQAVAVAFIYLAGKLRKYDLQSKSGSKSRSWWRQFVDTLDAHDLDSICHQVLDIYQESGKDTSDDQQSDDEPISRAAQSLAAPTPPSTGANGQLPAILPLITQTTPSTQAPLITWATPATLNNYTGQVQTAAPNHAQYQQTQASLPPTATTVGITTFALTNPLQALQNIQSAVQQNAAAAQVQFPSTQQLYRVPSVQAPSQTLVPPLVQPGMGGAYQYQVAQQTGYQTQIKAQQPYPLLGAQTGTVQQATVGFTGQTGQVGFTGQTGQVGFPSLIPGTGTVSQQSSMLSASNQLSRQAFTSPYHQSSMPATKPQQHSVMLPIQQQPLHQNTSYPSYTTQNVSYLPSTGLQAGNTHAQPLANTQVGGASATLGSHMMTGTQPYGTQQGVRGHTPSQNKPGWR